MGNPVGLRFLPTDEEIVDHYLRLKNHGGSTATHVDQVISTLDICNFDPCELPAQSSMASSDQVWYFFCRKQRRYNRGERQKRQTKSGFWKKTGTTLSIKRKSGDREKIGEKNVLVFCKNESKLSKKEKEKEKEKKGSKSNWVMHEYHHTSSFVSHQSVTYTICKVQRKDDASEISSSGTVMVEHSHSLVTPVNNPGGGLCMGPEIPRQLSGVFDKHQEMNLEEIQMAFDNLPSYINWENLLDDDGDHEQIKTA